jgi:hypothetical protein
MRTHGVQGFLRKNFRKHNHGGVVSMSLRQADHLVGGVKLVAWFKTSIKCIQCERGSRVAIQSTPCLVLCRGN